MLALHCGPASRVLAGAREEVVGVSGAPAAAGACVSKKVDSKATVDLDLSITGKNW
jgi:hypothetical protein